MVTQTNSQQFADKLKTPKRTHTNLRFPTDLETEGNGSIIRFKIALPENSNYFKSGQYTPVIDPSTGKTVNSDFRNEDFRSSIGRRIPNSYTMTTTTIDLFMPPQVQSSYQSNWKGTELGLAGGAIDATLGVWNSESKLSDISEYIKNNAAQNAARTAGRFIQGITPVNAKDAVSIITSTTDNPYIEVMFDGVQNRNFSFNFKFIPRNEKEQQIIKKIVKEFKFHQAPEFRSSSNNAYILFPSEFDIEFIHRDKENPWLFKISTCALNNVSINYSAEGRYKTYEDGSPFVTDLSLSFIELPILTKENIDKGF